jgi:shikimate kinase
MKIFLIGFMGSGKTHWGRLLSKKLGLAFYDLDSVIVDQEKRTVADIFSERGEEHFRYLEQEKLERIVKEQEGFILSCGGGTPCFFNNIEFMKKNGKVIWLNTSIEVLKQRLARDKKSRPLLRGVGDADDDLSRYILKKLSERRMYYQQADVTVNEESVTLDELVKLLFQNEKPDRMKEEI